MLRQGIQVLGADECDMQFVAEASNGREAIEQFRKNTAGHRANGFGDAGA